MFLDIGWPEFLLIGVVALLVIGPKDLPAALRVAGYWVRKARTMSREFQSHFEQMMREAELDEVRQELKKVTDINLDHEANKIMGIDGGAGNAWRRADRAEAARRAGLPRPHASAGRPRAAAGRDRRGATSAAGRRGGSGAGGARRASA